MNILHIVDSLRVGGAQALLITYAKEATKRGLETKIISLREKQESPIIKALEALDIAVEHLPKTSLWNIVRFIRLLRIIKKGKYNIIHSHLTHSNILGVACGMLLNIPVVVSMHNVLSGRIQNGPSEYLERFLLRYAKKIIAVGENVGSDYRRLYPNLVTVLPNAVNEVPELDKKERSIFRHELGAKEGDILLIAIGRLTDQKGFGDLLATFEIIHKKHPNTKLIIAGDGPLRSDLLKETEFRNLRDVVKWLGIRNDIPKLLAASDIYVSSSHWEGLSIALLEAMSAGLAPVVTNVGDAMKVITPDSGILVAPKDPPKMASAIDTLLKDPALIYQISTAAKARIRSTYNANMWFNKLFDIYRSVAYLNATLES